MRLVPKRGLPQYVVQPSKKPTDGQWHLRSDNTSYTECGLQLRYENVITRNVRVVKPSYMCKTCLKNTDMIALEG